MFNHPLSHSTASGNITITGNNTVEITTPGYPARFPTDTSINWIIRTGKDMKIAVNLGNLITEYNDHWMVGDGGAVGQSTFLSWRHRQRPLPDLLSGGSAIWISLVFLSTDRTRASFSFAVSSVASQGICTHDFGMSYTL